MLTRFVSAFFGIGTGKWSVFLNRHFRPILYREQRPRYVE